MGRYPRVLVTGASGQVGISLKGLLDRATFTTRSDLDVTERNEVFGAISRHDVVIHLAGATDVDHCEADPDLAYRVNGEGTRNICDAATSAGTRVIYVSTDYVFDGRKPGEYCEHDRTAPINHYGRSKLAGEREVLRTPDGLVVRTSWVIGPRDNFVRKILSAARSRSKIPVVSDQRGRPTFADDLAVALVWLVGGRTSGIVHVAGEGEPCTWAELAESALDLSRSTARITPITTAEYSSRAGRVIAPRPRNSTLSLETARSMGVPLTAWRDSLERYMKAIA